MKKSKDTTMKKRNREEESTVSQSNNNGGEQRNVITDPRFSSVHTDPRFQNVPRQRSKVVIDKRFERIFDDKSFASSSAPSDKRGKPRPKPKTAKEKLDSNPLHNYYRTEDERVEEGIKPKIIDRDSDDEEDSEEEVKVKDRVDLDKIGQEESDSDDEHEDSDEDDDDEDSDEDSMESTDDEEAFVENVPVTQEVTHRLAAVNMDWRHIKAVDLYEVLSTSLPKAGVINSVAVYPSEFGIKRMEEEAIHGPIALFGGSKGHNDDEDDDEDSDDDIDEEKLRAYEQSKLSYYYAVVDCDSSDTADHLYKSCDGVELERSSNMFDLRFIPDDMEFKHPPRDIATERPSNYKGLDFYTRELQHSKVNLTWDEDEPHRFKTLKRKFTEDQLVDLEFKEFLASSDESEAEDDGTKENEKKDRYRTLLLSGGGSGEDDEDEGQDMEVTFKSGLEDISKRILEKKDRKSESVWDAYQRKQREKKSSRKNRSKKSSDSGSSDDAEEPIEQDDDFFIEEEPTFKKNKETKSKSDKKEKQQMDKDDEASRAELELLLADDTGAKTTNVKGYNLKPKKVKGKKEKHVLEEEKLPSTDYDDPRFSVLFTSHLYALDPTDPNFKRSKAYVRQLAQKQHKADSEERGHKKREIETHLSSDDTEAKKQEKVKLEALASNKEKYEISSMVKSIKMKSKQLPSDGRKLKKDDHKKGGKDDQKKEGKMTKRRGER